MDEGKADMEPVLYETHAHTPLCGHAVGDVEAYAEAAGQRGLRGIIFTCHNPLPGGIGRRSRMAPEQFADYRAMVERARQAWAGRVDVRLGLECDYLPGFDVEQFLTDQSRSAPFDYLLGSIHPQLSEYRERYWRDDPVAYQRLYFQHLADTAELGLFDCISHPDLVKNLTAEHWDLERIWDDVLACLDRIAAAGIAMELNTSGWNKVVAEQNPTRPMLEQMAQRRIPLVLGADAHEPGRVAGRFGEALDLAEQAGYASVSYFLERRRRDVAIELARASLNVEEATEPLATEPSRGKA